MKFKKNIFISLSLLFLISTFCILAFSQEPSSALPRESLTDMMSKYVSVQRNSVQMRSFSWLDLVATILVDLPLSCFCFWLMLWLFKGVNDLSIMKLLSFLLVYNISRFMAFIFFKGLWWTLDFFVIRLDPSLKTIIADYFFIVFFVGMILLYIWILARSFKLDFIETVKVSLASHLAYFLIVFLVTRFINFESNQYLKLVNKNIGLAPIVQTHLIDAAKIVEKKSLLSLIEFRPFHI